MIDCLTISWEEQNWLQRPFPEEEVLNVIKQCDGELETKPQA